MSAAGETTKDAGPVALPDANFERVIRSGLWILAVGFGGFLAWGIFAPLDEAVPAPGVVSVESKRKRIILTGDVPSPVNPPTGCRFHSRCWRARQICSEVDPEFIEHSPRHWAACHFPG